jgi:hypothetical protein
LDKHERKKERKKEMDSEICKIDEPKLIHLILEFWYRYMTVILCVMPLQVRDDAFTAVA